MWRIDSLTPPTFSYGPRGAHPYSCTITKTILQARGRQCHAWNVHVRFGTWSRSIHACAKMSTKHYKGLARRLESLHRYSKSTVSNPMRWIAMQSNSNHFKHEFDSIQFNSIQFNSIQFNLIQFNSVQLNSMQFSTQFNSIQFNLVKFNSFNSI